MTNDYFMLLKYSFEINTYRISNSMLMMTDLRANVTF